MISETDFRDLDWTKSTIHFIDQSPFGYVSNGRDNWLLNVAEYLIDHYNINIHCTRPSGRRKFYNLKKIEQVGVIITRYRFTDNQNLFYRILNKISFYTISHIHSLVFSLRVLNNLKKIVKDYDIIFGFNPNFEALPGIFLKKKKYNIIDICLMKGKPAYESSEITPFLEKLFFTLEKYFVMNSVNLFSNAPDTQEYILSMYRRDSRIIRNGVNIKKYQNVQEEIFNRQELFVKSLKKEGVKILLFVGTLHWRKGIEFIFDLPLFLDKIYGGKYAIILIGKGKYDMYLDRIRKNGADDKIFFLGEQQNIPFFYHLSNLSLHLSYTQLGMGGVSHATLEALAAGSTIVAWNNRTYNQFLTSGFDSILVTEGNMEELSKALKKILENQTLSSRLRENSYKTVKPFDWQVVASELISALKKLQNSTDL
ncbi:glycosyltransferase family 4 protein [Bacteroidota bacterium]